MPIFAPLKNDRLLRALRFEPVDTTPIWLMGQAGRYLPEYNELCAKAGDFLSLCKDVDKATEAALQPLRRFDLDAAIVFGDILAIPDAFGLGLYFEAGEGPKLKHTVRSPTDLERLPTIDSRDSLSYMMCAITSTRKELGGQVPLFGFCGSPWTLATYMVEGGSSRDFRHIKAMIYTNPQLLHRLLAKVTATVTDCLVAQIEAGAQVLQLFDSWGGVLAHRQFIEFSHAYNKVVMTTLKQQYPDVPVVLFTKGGGQWLDIQADSGADGLGLDWTTRLNRAREQLATSQRTLTIAHKKLQQPKAIQGNLDPAVLCGDKASIRKAVSQMLDDAYASDKTGYIANLGRGMSQWIDPERVRIFVDAVHEYRI